MLIIRLISIIDEQLMLRFLVIIDFIDHQFLSIISAIRSVNWHRSVFIFKKRIPKTQPQTFVHSMSMYMHMLEHVGYRDFLTPVNDNRWVATTFLWLSIGHWLVDANRCQLATKASIVIDWFSYHRFHRLFKTCIVHVFPTPSPPTSHWQGKLIQSGNNDTSKSTS